MLVVCQTGYEAFAAKELSSPPKSRGPGWLLAEAAELSADACFPHYALVGEQPFAGDSARRLAAQLADFFLQSSRGERYEQPWPLLVEGADGLAKRGHGVEEVFLELLKARMARVFKLAQKGRPPRGAARGLFAFVTDEGRLFASRQAFFAGQRRMADDPQAPSRSYLKVEEAYVLLGEGPKEGELVVDLGAAPGGWSYSAAKRRARVVAVDNGPLKGGALNNPLIERRAEDAFKFEARCDWLFCDMIEEPDRVLDLLERWLARRGCRRFIVNLKFGRHDPLPLLRKARAALSPRCELLLARHLYHDREEFTLLGRAA